MSNPLVDSYLNECTKLDGKNYVNWKFKLMTVMEDNNLWSIVSGDEVKPTVVSSIPYWDKWEIKEKVLLRMSIKDNIIPHIRDFKMSKETWTSSKVCMKLQTQTKFYF